MRAYVFACLALLGCGGARSHETGDAKPLGYLVGSWRAVGPFGARVEFDLHANGTFALAYPEADGSIPCILLGTVTSNGSGYVSFDEDSSSPCGSDGDFYYRLEREEFDRFSYVQNSDFNKDCDDVPDCTLWTAVRAPGPLVPPELIAAAVHDAEETRRRWAEQEAARPYVPSDEPDEPVAPAAPAAPNHDAEIAALMTVREQLVDDPYLDGYSTRVWNTHNPEGQSGPTDYAFTSSWVMYPDLTLKEDRDVEYAIVVIVPSSARDPQGSFSVDDEVIALERATSADGAWYFLGGRLELVRGSGSVEVEVHYWSGSSDGSILGLYR